MSTFETCRGFPGRFLASLAMSAVLWGLAGCQTTPPKEELPAPPAPSPEFAIPANSAEYRVLPAESLLQILVYRGGAMARLGHNHVIASHSLSGSVYVTEDLQRTRFDVRLPVNELTVDEPEQREKAGTDFPPGVPESARTGTRTNLLSEPLLDGAKYPEIRLRALDVVAAGEGYDVTVEVTIKDQVRLVHAPATVEHANGRIRASGEFPLKQSDLGLKPFSVAMGTLVVLDDMKVRFEVVAGR